jgi:hypothetical protein
VPADSGQLDRLAGLDSKRVPEGPFVVAEVDGRLLAARSLEDGAVIADPFEHTAQLSALLRMRAKAIHAYVQTPSLRERMLAGVRVTGAWRAGHAS